MFKTIKRWIVDPGEKDKPKEEIVVSLEELSAIWLPYNKDFEPQKTHPTDSELIEYGAEVDASDEPPPPDILNRSYVYGRLSPESQNIIATVLRPYEEACMRMNALDGICRIIEILDEQGGCPSIVLVGKDTSENDFNSLRDVLAKVTLRAHCHRVAMLGVERVKKDWRDPFFVIPIMIVAALGHDLGKIESQNEVDTYSKYDHPTRSAQIVASIFSEQQDERWLQEALNAIRKHHSSNSNSSPSQLLADLRFADGKARETEISNITGRMIKEWKEWFDPRVFIDLLRPRINVTQTGNKWSAFTYRDVVYCTTKLLHETAKKYAESQNVVDISVIRDRDLPYALRNIIKSLRAIDAVSPELANLDHYARNYELRISNTTRKEFLVPLKVEVFGLKSELDRSKEGFFNSIKSIRPL